MVEFEGRLPCPPLNVNLRRRTAVAEASAFDFDCVFDSC